MGNKGTKTKEMVKQPGGHQVRSFRQKKLWLQEEPKRGYTGHLFVTRGN
jgi:hypothetical protein